MSATESRDPHIFGSGRAESDAERTRREIFEEKKQLEKDLELALLAAARRHQAERDEIQRAWDVKFKALFTRAGWQRPRN